MLYATPYNISQSGFYFSSIDEYDNLFEKHPCEEFEIQFIDGDNPKLFSAAKIDQGNLTIWFDVLADISDDDDKSIQIQHLLDTGYILDETILRYDEVCLFHGSASGYAYDLYNECYDIPEHLTHYIDYDKIANDMLINGEISEYSPCVFIVNA